MEGVFWQGGEDAVFAVGDGFQGVVGCDHGEGDLRGLDGLRGGFGFAGAEGDEVGGFASGAVIEGEAVAGFDEVGGHADAHLAEAEEGDVHFFGAPGVGWFLIRWLGWGGWQCWVVFLT